jgi:hypothetical protein
MPPGGNVTGGRARSDWQSNELTMTQELMANMLGVRREGVTESAGKLHEAGLINYRRGRTTVLDRRGLERRVCECYKVVKAEFDRLLPRTSPGSPPGFFPSRAVTPLSAYVR